MSLRDLRRLREGKEAAMPDDQSTTNELSLDQIIFVSKYLKVVPKPSWRPFGKSNADEIRRVESANETVKRNFGEFQRARDHVARQIAEMVRIAGDRLKQYQAAADADPLNKDPEFVRDIGEFGKRLAELKTKVRDKVKEVGDAPETAPRFGDGAQALLGYGQDLTRLEDDLPDLPPVVVRSVVGSLLAIAARVSDMKAFVGVGGLSREMAERRIDDDAAETRRVRALEDYDDVCDKARKAIDGIIDEARGQTRRTDGQMRDEAETLASAVPGDCAPYLAALRAVLNEAALSLVQELKGDGDKTAEREVYRLDELRKRTGKLDTGITAIETRLVELQQERANATGFNEKREITAQYKAEKARLDELKARRAQFDLYKDAFAGRMARLEAVKDQYNSALDIAADPDTFLQARAPLPPATEITKFALLGGPMKKGVSIGDIEEYRARFKRASTTVVPQDQLFMGEPGVSDITGAQFQALSTLLDKARQMAEAGQLAEGQALLKEAIRLFGVFQESTKFMLPAVPEAPPSQIDRTERDLKRLSVQLDRFWGRGGDGDDALRKRLDEIVKARDTALNKAPLALSDVEDAIVDFRRQLDAAERGFVTNPQDQLSRDKAAGAGNQIKKDLLNLFETRPVAEADVGKIDSRRLLIVRDGNGNRSYHEILTQKDGTQTRRKNSHVPREAMEMMLEKARMLDALAGCESPDCAEMIDAAVNEAEADLLAIKGGDKAYDHIASQIKKCEVLVGDKLFGEWLPAGFGDVKVRYQTFKKDYARTMRPGDASAKADEFHDALTQLKKDAETLKTDYKTVSGKLDKVSTDLDGKKAKAGTLGQKLEKMVKDGPEVLIKKLSLGRMSKDEHAEVTRLMGTLRTDLKYLKDKSKDFHGLEGRLAGRIAVARQTLDTKTTDGVQRAGQIADELARDARDQANDLDALDIGANGLADFRKLVDFVSRAAGGVRTKDDLKTRAERERLALKGEIETARAFLKKNRGKMGSYTEYAAVCDSIDKQYQSITAVYARTGDADQALSQLTQQTRSAKQLNDEMKDNLLVPEQSGKKVTTDFITRFGEELAKSLGHVQDNAATLGLAIKERSEEDEGQKGNADLQRNVAAVKAVLELAKRGEVTALAALKPSIKDDIDRLLALAPTTAGRKAGLATAREAALANVRDIRARLDADPALKVYRDNPFDKGASWPALASALHQLETRLIKDLDPRKL
ncbi:MAG: hypothetical protein CML66_20470 [Rhodobacteraceae bacterium]|nr:hypothetical protein [Paracoccaceae bacterium]MAY44446.1 hypothetical protein [Paracoccaceae bacterium]